MTTEGALSRIRPIRNPGGRPGYRVSFRHPLHDGKVTTVGLGTQDFDQAVAICRDLTRICDDGTLWTDKKDPRLGAYDPKAVSVFFGENSEQASLARTRATIARSDVKAIVENIVRDARGLSLKALIQKIRDVYEGELSIQRDKRVEDERTIKGLREQLADKSEELQRLKRIHNQHTTATMAEARKLWKAQYSPAIAASTSKKAFRALDLFITSLAQDEKTRVGAVTAREINAWVAGLVKAKADDDGKPVPLAAPTRRNMKAYVSTFWTWATVHYDLNQNPMDRSAGVGGMSRHPENIVAIRRLEDIQTLLEKLKRWPYWRAWVATAILAGPRWGEQNRLTIDDVFLDEGYLLIRTQAPGRRSPKKGTKTGRERRVPIEQTTLLEILRQHVATRRAEQQVLSGQDAAAKASPFLFPTTSLPNQWSPRKKTEDGPWSSGRNFLDRWADIAAAAAPGRPSFWRYGPSQWRHTAGTILGMCGWTSLEICTFMGNSEKIARDHYVAAISAGKRWPFKWDGHQG